MPLPMENVLVLMGGDFKFYCLQIKSPVGMRVKCSFPMRMKFQGTFINEMIFWPIFPVGRGFHWVCERGGVSDTNENSSQI